MLGGGLMDLEAVFGIVRAQRNVGRVVGFTSGVFDLLHYGHLNYLSQCRKICDYLVVGIDADGLVMKKKGTTRPNEPELVRVDNVLATHVVHAAFVKSGSSNEFLGPLRPDIFFTPSNRQINARKELLIKMAGILQCVIPYTDGISTTLIMRSLPNFAARATVQLEEYH